MELLKSLTECKIEMPKPFPFIPTCSYSLLESYVKYKGIYENLDYLFIDHSIKYNRKSENVGFMDENYLDISIGIRANDIVDFYKDGKDISVYSKNIFDFYGLEINYDEFVDSDIFIKYVSECLKSNEPVIYTYDLGYVPTRRHYRKFFGQHTICIIGYSQKDNKLLCMEQALYPYFSIGEEDFIDCFNHVKNQFGAVKVLKINKVDSEKVPSKEFLKQIAANIVVNTENFNTSYGRIGLNRFYADFSRYLEQKNDSKPFLIQDMWSISHERITAKKWLDRIHKDTDFLSNELYCQMTSELQKLFNNWSLFDFTCERACVEKNWKYTDQIKTTVSNILKSELEMYAVWNEIANI